MPDLWPDDLGQITVNPPVRILREQAESLGRKTRGLVEGRVVTSPDGRGNVEHRFLAVVPSMYGYSFQLLTLRHSPLVFYPVQVIDDVEESREYPPAESEEELVAQLRQILASESTLKVIRALRSQAEENPIPQ